MLVFEEGGKPSTSYKLNPELNPSHIGGRRALTQASSTMIFMYMYAIY